MTQRYNVPANTTATFPATMTENLSHSPFVHAAFPKSQPARDADRRPQTADRRPQTADRRPQTADRRPQTADRRPQTADRRPQTADTSK